MTADERMSAAHERCNAARAQLQKKFTGRLWLKFRWRVLRGKRAQKYQAAMLASFQELAR
jgi:hypothetical protein